MLVPDLHFLSWTSITFLSMPGSDLRGNSGGLGAPTSTTWRRQRLLRIGSTNSVNTPLFHDAANGEGAEQSAGTPETQATEGSSLQAGDANGRSYGTLPSPSSRRRLFHKDSFRNVSSRRGAPDLPNLDLPPRSNSIPLSTPASPTYTPSVFRELAYSRLSALTAQRPISAYDEPIDSKYPEASDEAIDAKINGVRVWYSSFSSIDWLHDAIKDSVRFSKLRRRKSVRARIRLAIDKSLGWLIVTIVGFITAIVAFLVVRSEQWLFDLKEGHCRTSLWKAKRFCCPQLDETTLFLPDLPSESECPAWEPWSETLSWRAGDKGEDLIEYVSYAVVAVSRSC